MPLGGLSFVKTLATFRLIIYATDQRLQNMTTIIWIRWLTFDLFDISNYKSLQFMLNYMGQFFKIKVVFHTLYLWNEVGNPQFVCISVTSNSLSDCSKKFKKSIYRKIFARTGKYSATITRHAINLRHWQTGNWATSQELLWPVKIKRLIASGMIIYTQYLRHT